MGLNRLEATEKLERVVRAINPLSPALRASSTARFKGGKIIPTTPLLNQLGFSTSTPLQEVEVGNFRLSVEKECDSFIYSHKDKCFGKVIGIFLQLDKLFLVCLKVKGVPFVPHGLMSYAVTQEVFTGDYSAFLFAYIVMVLVEGLPLFCLELAIGNHFKKSVTGSMKVYIYIFYPRYWSPIG
eukprot:sb/3471560/